MKRMETGRPRASKRPSDDDDLRTGSSAPGEGTRSLEAKIGAEVQLSSGADK